MTDYEPAIASMLRPGSRWSGLNADRQQADMLRQAIQRQQFADFWAEYDAEKGQQPVHVHDFQWDAGWFLFRCACGGASYVGTD